MRIIASTRLRTLAEPFPHARHEIEDWIARVRLVTWASPNEVRQTDPRASIIANRRVVFNICGNDLRLIVKIDYVEQQVFIRWFGTHADYSRLNAAEI
jgi:mRNA interferase HigB